MPSYLIPQHLDTITPYFLNILKPQNLNISIRDTGKTVEGTVDMMAPDLLSSRYQAFSY
jgi:hypothetical protein